jgi:TetR/AcrR family transcriptional regulator, transcriptional repressor of bet genes
VAANTIPRRPPGGSQERAEHTRAAVIDEAITCVLDEGFAAPSVRHITERAGVTWGVVQYHFGDLSGLLMAVVDKGFSELTESLEGLPAKIAALPPRARTQAVVDAAWTAFSSRTSLAAFEILVSTRALRDAVVDTRLVELGNSLTALGRHLGEGLDTTRAGEIGNLIWATLRGLAVADLISPHPLDSANDRRMLVDVITAYITAQAAEQGSAGG